MENKISDTSARLHGRACRVMPGGVNSPVRAFNAVGGEPVVMTRGQGSRLYSVDGREYIDFCGSWGPLILGHAHPTVTAAVQRAAADGTSFGTSTPSEVELAERLCDLIAAMERVRLVNSGTEACMTAVRLARGFTGRAKILKFAGGYHGHADPFLIDAGSGLLTGGIASSAGIPDAVGADTLVTPYNDPDAVNTLMQRYGTELAAVIVEPVAGNMGLVPPVAGFLEELRRLTRDAGVVLVFDEVITGFRLGPTTFGTLQGIEPDLICLGKIIGGGMPMAALGGRADIMDRLAPLGDVYQAGTLSGNPLAVAAGLSTLGVLIGTNPYPAIARKGERLAKRLRALAVEQGITMQVAQLGGMFTPFFGSGPIRNLDDAKRCDKERYARFFRKMLQAGIYLPPSPFETCFISTAHTNDDIEKFIDAAKTAVRD